MEDQYDPNVYPPIYTEFPPVNDPCQAATATPWNLVDPDTPASVVATVPPPELITESPVSVAASQGRSSPSRRSRTGAGTGDGRRRSVFDLIGRRSVTGSSSTAAPAQLPSPIQCSGNAPPPRRPYPPVTADDLPPPRIAPRPEDIPTPRVTIHHAMYPHLIDAMIRYSDMSTLFNLRLLCSEFQHRIDAYMFRHLVVTPPDKNSNDNLPMPAAVVQFVVQFDHEETTADLEVTTKDRRLRHTKLVTLIARGSDLNCASLPLLRPPFTHMPNVELVHAISSQGLSVTNAPRCALTCIETRYDRGRRLITTDMPHLNATALAFIAPIDVQNRQVSGVLRSTGTTGTVGYENFIHHWVMCGDGSHLSSNTIPMLEGMSHLTLMSSHDPTKEVFSFINPTHFPTGNRDWPRAGIWHQLLCKTIFEAVRANVSVLVVRYPDAMGSMEAWQSGIAVAVTNMILAHPSLSPENAETARKRLEVVQFIDDTDYAAQWPQLHRLARMGAPMASKEASLSASIE